MRREDIVLIAPTYKRPEICNRLLESKPKWMKAVIVSLSGKENINASANTIVIESNQMPLTNALNLGVACCDEKIPDAKAYLLTDDDVIFCEQTIISDNITSLLEKKDTGLVAITRIINNKTTSNKNIESPFVYKGGGYFIKKDVFHAIGGYTENNSADEWDICIKSYIYGYRNYRTQTSYAYHKQGSTKGGYSEAVKEGSSLGNVNNWLATYIQGHIHKNSGYEYIHKDSIIKPIAHHMHKANNARINRRA
jgi:hypothetical protein